MPSTSACSSVEQEVAEMFTATCSSTHLISFHPVSINPALTWALLLDPALGSNFGRRLSVEADKYPGLCLRPENLCGTPANWNVEDMSGIYPIS